MTARELIQLAGERPAILLALAAAPPLVALLVSVMHPKERGQTTPWKYVYSALVYAVSFPGILAAILVAYALFFTNENLLDVNLLVYVLPVATMVATLVLVRRAVGFDDIPGFDRLAGLVVLIAMTFVLVLAIRKTAIWIFFGGSIPMLVALVGALFALLKWGARAAFGPRGAPKEPPPVDLDGKTGGGRP